MMENSMARKGWEKGGIMQKKRVVNELNVDNVAASFHMHIGFCCLSFYMLLSANRNHFCVTQTGIHFAFVQISSSGNSEIGESADYPFVEKVKNSLIQRIFLDFPVFSQALIPTQPKQTKECSYLLNTYLSRYTLVI